VRQRFLNSISKDEALSKWLESFRGRPDSTEVLPVIEALGRITATPIVAKNSSPHYVASAMDGIAVMAANTAGAAPGRARSLALGKDCFAVDTGDPLPPGTDAVIMVENVVQEDENCLIEQSVSPWQNVRPIGEDIVQGEVLLGRYHCITPVDLGALLAAGVLTLSVLAKPRVEIIPTGDELVLPGAPLKEGDIVEFNSAMIAGEVTLWGGVPIVHEPVADNTSLIKRAVEQALRRSDLVVVIAGSSTGRGDTTAEVLADVGEIVLHGVAMRPGKPVVLAKSGFIPMIGLPGYPVSAHHCLELFVKPLIFDFTHRPKTQAEEVLGLLTRRLVSPFGVEEFVRVQVGQVDGQVVVTPLSRGAGIVTSLMRSDGTLVIPPSAEGVPMGATVKVRLRRPLTEVTDTLVCIGSHDLVLDVLADLLRVRFGLWLQTSHVGSMVGLLALKAKHSHFCTSHLLDEDTGEYNLAHVKRLFEGEEMAVINLVERWQGFMCRAGTKISDWQELSGVGYINRQRGSGTRVLLDYHLKRNGLDPRTIVGYEREETTHLAVACAVSNGSADVGLGIQSAADSFGLSFVPMCLEHFDIIVRAATLLDPRMQAILAVVRSVEFAANVGKLGGYETRKSGEVVWSGYA